MGAIACATLLRRDAFCRDESSRDGIRGLHHPPRARQVIEVSGSFASADNPGFGSRIYSPGCRNTRMISP
jgi:hypothetical protein